MERQHHRLVEAAPGQRIEIGEAAIKDDRMRGAVTSDARPVYYAYQDHVTRAQTYGSYAGTWTWGELQARAYRSVLERVNERDQNQTPTRPTRPISSSPAKLNGRLRKACAAGWHWPAMPLCFSRCPSSSAAGKGRAYWRSAR